MEIPPTACETILAGLWYLITLAAGYAARSIKEAITTNRRTRPR
jgi:hypothetical protein